MEKTVVSSLLIFMCLFIYHLYSVYPLQRDVRRLIILKHSQKEPKKSLYKIKIT